MTNEQGRDITALFWTLSEKGTPETIPNRLNVFDYLNQSISPKNAELLNRLLDCVGQVKNDVSGGTFKEADKPMLFEVWFFWLKNFSPDSWAVYRKPNSRGVYVPSGYGCGAAWKNIRLCLCYSYLKSEYFKSLSNTERIPIYGLE